MTSRNHHPQAFISTFAPRLRKYSNALLQPVAQPATILPNVRTTKRGTTAINYAEDGFDTEDFDDSEGTRRPIRSLRAKQDPVQDLVPKPKELGKPAYAPVEVQGIWRDWMAKPGRLITEKQQYIQCVLPLHLVPIRIDVDIQPFRPEAPLPAPQNSREYGIDDSLPAYKPGEPTPPFRLKDAFLWNLHEALTTPDQFAKRLVEELDFPMRERIKLIPEIATQIRKQLEDHAEFALHPLFQPVQPFPMQGQPPPPATNGQPLQSQPNSSTPLTNGHTPHPTTQTPASDPSFPVQPITATATLPPPTRTSHSLSTTHPHNPDDTYRCLLTLSINLLNTLYTDKFEWSLIHPPGLAESFARRTASDLGLTPEWAMAIAHAIYEAVLRLRKDIVENGGLPAGQGYAGELDNDAAWGGDAGWRFDPENGLGEGWEPRLEELSKEEIEKREGDRERQLRRARRETARFVGVGYGVGSTGGGGGLFDQFTDPTESERMGRGERRKTKRRFRSASPEGTPDTNSGGGPGGMGVLDASERPQWRCTHCGIWGNAVWGVRDGPTKARSLCQNCGVLYDRDKRLPLYNKDFFREGVVVAPGGAAAGAVRR